MHLNNAIDDDIFGKLIASVKIDGSHKGFKGIASHRLETQVIAHIGCMSDVGLETKFLRKFVERNTADDARAHLREETLRLCGIGVEKIVGHGKTEHGITKILHALIAHVVVAHRFIRLRLMGESHAIQRDVFRIEAQNAVDIIGKPLVLGVESDKKRGKSHLRIGTF